MPKKVLILSGAGLSAKSGLKTFRDSDGLWEEYDIKEVCSSEGYFKDRDKVLKFYDARRAQLENCTPNEAHKIIANLKNRYPNDIEIITQNVDNLLERAGCLDVIHVHGTLTDGRCEECFEIFDIGYELIGDKICPKCKSREIRHNVVMFGESAPMYKKLYETLECARLFVAVGTSGNVLNIAYMAHFAEFSIVNNLDKDDTIDEEFDIAIHECATTGMGKVANLIEKFLEDGKLDY